MKNELTYLKNNNCSCADLIGGTGGSGPLSPPPTRMNVHKAIGFLSIGPDSLKTTNVWLSSARQRNAILMAFRSRTDYGPLLVVSVSSFPSSTKETVVRVGPPLTNVSGSAHANLNCASSISFSQSQEM